MLGSYASLFRSTPGWARFSVPGLIARFPASMTGMALVLLFSRRAGYTYAGAIAGAYAMASAATAPLVGRVIDRRGQRPVLWSMTSAYAACLCALVGAWIAAANPYLQMGLAAAAGATVPRTGPMIRARWSSLLRGTPELHTALAWESTLDQVIFTAGPILVGILSSVAHPIFALLALLIMSVTGSLGLAVATPGEPTATAPPLNLTHARPRTHELPILQLSFIGLGAVFGALQIAVLAATGAQHSGVSGGIVLGAWSAGSLVAAVALGHRRSPTNTTRRLVISACAMPLALLPMVWAANMGWLTLCALVAGSTVSPLMVSVTALVESHTASSRMVEALAWNSAALGLGSTAGSCISGAVADHLGATHALTVPVIAALLGACLALMGCFLLGRRPSVDDRPLRRGGCKC
ncbi:MFS transporter [Streptomyces sp. NPDC058251]